MTKATIYKIVAFVAIFIILDEIAFYWWRKLTPGHMYSVVSGPSPLVGYNGNRPINTPKTDTNRFYPQR